VHTLHWGRGRYVLIHADEVMSPEGKVVEGKKARIETFVVGKDIQKGEKVQWIVEGGKYKASYLLPDQEGDEEKRTEGLLISEVRINELLIFINFRRKQSHDDNDCSDLGF